MKTGKNERNIRLILSYEGTHFAGWQVQDHHRTVQGTIEDALEKIHGHSVRITASGRTDSGVHALGQVANFYTDMDSIPAGRFSHAINSHLPQDVLILRSDEVGNDFHSRYSARIRIYEYKIRVADLVPPHEKNFCMRVKSRPDLRVLDRYCSLIVGKHDFSGFADARDGSKDKTRLVHSAGFYPEGRFIVFRIVANAFLWKMVRSLVGTMLEFERKKIAEEKIRENLETGNRELSGTTAPPQGLYLVKVMYGTERTYY